MLNRGLYTENLTWIKVFQGAADHGSKQVGSHKSVHKKIVSVILFQHCLCLLSSILLFDLFLRATLWEQTEYLGVTAPQSSCTKKEPKKLLFQLSAALIVSTLIILGSLYLFFSLFF